jgi:hypothetical protein
VKTPQGKPDRSYRVIRQTLPLDYSEPPELSGILGPDGSPPPSSAPEARDVGIRAAEDGLELREVMADALRRWPGSVRTLPGLLAAGAKGWCATARGWEVSA